jgi:tetratricopeptide (TPR) repeat protein
VREVDGKKHFLCARCGARGRWKLWLAVALGVAAVAAASWSYFSTRGAGATPAAEDPALLEARSLAREAVELMKGGKYPEARERLHRVLLIAPEALDLNVLMGRCLRQMSYFESSIPHWRIVSERSLEGRDESLLELGVAFFRMGRAAEAVKYLDKPFESAPLERARQMTLAECNLELELYPDALKILQEWPPVPGAVWVRHRALSYQGRVDEARKAIESLEGKTLEERLLRATLEASLAREEGDFAAAGKALESAAGAVERGTSEWAKIKRSEIALRIESGDVAALAAVAEELSGASGGHVKGVAFWGRAMARLLAGRREEAAAAAREFLSQTDPEYTPLRMERLMMLHLAGEIKDEAFEAEVRSTPRSWQNDLLYYRALAKGDRPTAERALQATPGRNFPYYAIRRLLGP